MLSLVILSAIVQTSLQVIFQASLHASDVVNQVRIEEGDGYRYIYSNGIPNHPTGTFPNAGNPNRISPQEHVYRVTLTPELSGDITQIRPAFGVALNGIPFEPGTGEFWNRDRQSQWKFEALTGFINLGTDENNAHVQPTGSYHYHGIPTGLVTERAMTHIGYAADGFPMYGPYGYADANDTGSELIDMRSSYQLKAGLRSDGPGGLHDGAFYNDFEYVAGLGELDECNGRFGVTPEYPDGIYHYYVTEMFPFVPRCVKGTPDESFGRQGGRHGGGEGQSERRSPERRPERRSSGRRHSDGESPHGHGHGHRHREHPPGQRPHSPNSPNSGRGGPSSHFYEPSFPSEPAE